MCVRESHTQLLACTIIRALFTVQKLTGGTRDTIHRHSRLGLPDTVQYSTHNTLRGPPVPPKLPHAPRCYDRHPSRRKPTPKPSATPQARACSADRMGSCKVCVSERAVTVPVRQLARVSMNDDAHAPLPHGHARATAVRIADAEVPRRVSKRGREVAGTKRWDIAVTSPRQP